MPPREPVTTAAPPDRQQLPLADRITSEFLLHHRLCPTGVRADGALAVAIVEASILDGLDDLSIAYGRPVAPVLTTPQDLDLEIARLASADGPDLQLELAAREDDTLTSDVRDLANQPPVVRFVNLLIREAYDAGASDIHLESTAQGLGTRFRIDGVLLPALEPPGSFERAVVSRIKLLADLDIAERRKPQDGKIRVRLHDRELDLRVSTVPTVFGESVVLRLLERGSAAIGLETLGLSPGLLDTMDRLAQKPHGMILVTGPTGSGKTTTLYAALGLRSAATEKIITLEDPVEYTLHGVAQVPVQTQTGVTFASMLRSILRQDPDVVLVGEMRDRETAELAVQAALTGHVVFSTLHTNDAVGAIPRLLDLGVAPYLVSATVEAILAQRLVRRICTGCREVYRPDRQTPLVLAHEPRADLWRGRGCPQCRGTGYRGRIGIFELLTLTDEIREAIVRGTPRAQLDDLAADAGMIPLRSDGWAKVCEGLTTPEEVLRVTQV